MSNIVKHPGRNTAGLIPIWWAFASDINRLTIDKPTLHCAIELKAGKKWNYMYGTDETIDFDSEETAKPAGTQYSYKLKFLVPKDRPSVEITLRQMERRGLVIHVTDKNGVMRILGTDENPMRKSGKLKKPANLEGFNGWEVTFQGDFSMPAFYGDELDADTKNEIIPEE